MANHRFLIHRRALTAYYALTEPERDALESIVGRFVDLPEGHWAEAGAVRLDSPEALYLIKVDESLRAILRRTIGGQPELLDLVRHETLQRYFMGVG